MNHTKEPWRAKADPSYYGIVSEIYAMDKFIASLGGVCSPDEVEANARRIVACVNGCSDIPDEDLDTFFKWARSMWFRQKRLLTEEREKLAKMNDKERAEYEARREATLEYNLRALRRTYDRVDETV